MHRLLPSPRICLPSFDACQDPKELFDLYEPPTPEEKAGAMVTKLRPAGRRKARALVHAEGDWHRSVGLLGTPVTGWKGVSMIPRAGGAGGTGVDGLFY